MTPESFKSAAPTIAPSHPAHEKGRIVSDATERRKRYLPLSGERRVNPDLGPRPAWMRVRTPTHGRIAELESLVRDKRLHTVCESANCPNRGECWSRGTATLMILGNICTRSCGFCAVKTGRPTELDLDEARRVADAVEWMSLRYVVLTSVDRDDLADGGAGIWAACIRAVRERCPETGIETLIPDFQGAPTSLEKVFAARPDVLAHNLETVRRLAPNVRPQARYDRSLGVIAAAKAAGLVAKSGMMLGLGESNEEVIETMGDLRAAGCDVLTLGQYLQPTPEHLPIERWVTPEEFAMLRDAALRMGFFKCDSGPLVRSSYHAEEILDAR